MSNCEQYRPYLAALADVDLEAIPSEIRESLRAHVAACPACQAELAEQQQISRLFAAQVPPTISAERWQKAWDAVDAQTTSRTIQLRATAALRAWPRWGAVAASAAVAAILAFAVLLWPNAATQLQQQVALTPATEPADMQPAFAFATAEDTGIQAIEAFGQEQTPMIITTGKEDLLVVWVVQEENQETGA